MHHYPFHVGDYLLATAHLPDLADLAYRRILDLYYMEEAPIPAKPKWVATRIRMASEVELVTGVLRSFFTLDDSQTPSVYRNKRADAEIAKYQKKVDIARKNGTSGGRKPKSVPTLPADRGITRTRTRTNKAPIAPTGGFDEWYALYPLKKARQDAIKAFQKLNPDEAMLATLIAAIKLQVAVGHFTNASGVVVPPNPATWLNGRRWEDEVVKPVPPGSAATDPEARSSVEAQAKALGLPAWDEKEQWSVYRARVRAAVAAKEQGDGNT